MNIPWTFIDPKGSTWASSGELIINHFGLWKFKQIDNSLLHWQSSLISQNSIKEIADFIFKITLKMQVKHKTESPVCFLIDLIFQKSFSAFGNNVYTSAKYSGKITVLLCNYTILRWWLYTKIKMIWKIDKPL